MGAQNILTEIIICSNRLEQFFNTSLWYNTTIAKYQLIWQGATYIKKGLIGFCVHNDVKQVLQ